MAFTRKRILAALCAVILMMSLFAGALPGNINLGLRVSAELTGNPTITLDKNTGMLTAGVGDTAGGNGDPTYAWTGDGIDATGNTLDAISHLGKEITLTITYSDETSTAVITVYQVTVSSSGTATDDGDVAASINDSYGEVGDTISIAYTLADIEDNDSITYAGGIVAEVTTAGSEGSSYYVVVAEDDTDGDGVIALTATFAHTATPKEVTVGTQSAGTITEGVGGAAEYDVDVTGIDDGEYQSPTVTNIPSGVTAETLTISGGEGTLTLTVDDTAEAGEYTNLTLTIDGTTSAQFTLTIAEAPPALDTAITLDPTSLSAKYKTTDSISITPYVKHSTSTEIEDAVVTVSYTIDGGASIPYDNGDSGTLMNLPHATPGTYVVTFGYAGVTGTYNAATNVTISYVVNAAPVAKTQPALTQLVISGATLTVNASDLATDPESQTLKIKGISGNGTNITITEDLSTSQTSVTLTGAVETTEEITLIFTVEDDMEVTTTVQMKFEVLEENTELFALTVTDGTGSGNYAAGTEVTITAGDPIEGEVFSRWIETTDPAINIVFDDEYSSTTTITMLAGEAIVEAIYDDASYALTLVRATAASDATPITSGDPVVYNALVTVTASTTQATAFTGWTFAGIDEGDVTMDDNGEPDTEISFNMPDNAVTITANYAAAPPPTPTVTAVTVSPATAEVEMGSTRTFTAAVTGTNSPAQTVTWKVTGGTDSTITSAGVLTVGEDETATTLTVTATSTANTAKSGTATVTVKPAPEVPKLDTTISVSGVPSGNYVYRGDSIVELTAYIISETGETVSGSIEVTTNGTAQNSIGKATIYTATTGTYKVTFTFAGNSAYKGSTVTVTVDVVATPSYGPSGPSGGSSTPSTPSAPAVTPPAAPSGNTGSSGVSGTFTSGNVTATLNTNGTVTAAANYTGTLNSKATAAAVEAAAAIAEENGEAKVTVNLSEDITAISKGAVDKLLAVLPEGMTLTVRQSTYDEDGNLTFRMSIPLTADSGNVYTGVKEANPTVAESVEKVTNAEVVAAFETNQEKDFDEKVRYTIDAASLGLDDLTFDACEDFNGGKIIYAVIQGNDGKLYQTKGVFKNGNIIFETKRAGTIMISPTSAN